MKNKSSGGEGQKPKIEDGRSKMDAGELRRVALDKIVPSPFQNRKTFKTADWAGFVESVRVSGVIQPGVGREVNGHVELVCGERRFRASQELKLAEMPLIIRPLTDEQVQEMLAVENLQREGLNPLEEAQGFADWIARILKAGAVKTMKEAVAYVSERVGKGRSMIYESLRLVKLSPAVQKALQKGELDPTKAQLFGQVPPEQHGKLLKEVTRKDHWNGGTMSVNKLRELIDRDYSRQLSGAPWKWDDAELLKSAGPCATCPKRSGNIEGLEGNPNICTDVKCFEEKQTQHAMRTLNQAKEQGKRIIPSETYERRSYDFEKPDHKPWQDTKRRTWAQLAKVAGVEPAVTVNREGKAIEVFAPEDRAKIFKANKIESNSGSSSGNGNWEKQQAAKRKKKLLLKKADGIIRPKLLEAVKKTKPTVKFWQWLVMTLIDHEHKDVLYRRGVIELGKAYSGNPERKYVESIKDEGELRALVVDALASAEPEGYNSPDFADSFQEACRGFGVDFKKPLAAVTAEAKAKQKPAKKTKGKK